MNQLLWEPSPIEVGDVGYIRKDGVFITLCTIWKVTGDDLGLPERKFQSMRAALPREDFDNWDLPNERVKKKALSVSTSLTTMRRNYNEWEGVKLKSGPDADYRYKGAKLKKLKMDDLANARAFWQKWHGDFEEKYRKRVEENERRVYDLMLGAISFPSSFLSAPETQEDEY